MMNARLLAWIYGALACGGELDGARLLSTECIRTFALETTMLTRWSGCQTPKGSAKLLGGELSPMGSRLTAIGRDKSRVSTGYM
jgi:hypothetical protein